MPRILAAIIAAAFVSAATAASTIQAEAGYRGCRAPAGASLITDAYGYGRYGRYEFGYCGGYSDAGPPPYYPPPYTEFEPAFDGPAGPVYNPNAYYDFPSYRRVYYRERPCCRP